MPDEAAYDGEPGCLDDDLDGVRDVGETVADPGLLDPRAQGVARNLKGEKVSMLSVS